MHETPAPLPPTGDTIYGFRNRMERDCPEFSAHLRSKPHIQGWSHNPWQDAATPDAIATRLADQWQRTMTDKLIGMGFFPYMGVEINVPVLGRHGRTADEVLAHYQGSHQTMGEILNDYYPVASQRRIPKRINSAQTNDNISSNTIGRAYMDSREIEIATHAQSPMATVARVNRIKRLAYEASADFAHEHYSRRAAPAQSIDAVRSPSARILANECPAFRVTYARNNLNGNVQATAEHLNFSLVHHDPDHITDYATTQIDSQSFCDRNLFNKGSWKNLFYNILRDHLSADTLLAYGMPNSLNYQKSNQKHSIKVHPQAAEKITDNRLEIRSLNDASSNLSLTSFAVTAIAYATMSLIMENSVLRHRYGDGRHDISDSDAVYIQQRLEKMAYSPEHVPATPEEAVEYFAHSLTIASMKHYARQTPPAERSALEQEIQQFQQAVIGRYYSINAAGIESLTKTYER